MPSDSHRGAAIWPLFDLTIRSPWLELRPLDQLTSFELIELAAQGIHDPGSMPFLVPFTDDPPALMARRSLQHHQRWITEFAPSSWHLPMAVFDDGTLAGVQEVFATDFLVRRTVESGSWLGQAHQGRGIGREMRAMVLQLAFEGLGARRAETAAFQDNAPSNAVTRSLGYVENGDEIRVRRESADRIVRYRLEREVWEQQVRRDDIELAGLTPECLELFGLDADLGPLAAP